MDIMSSFSSIYFHDRELYLATEYGDAPAHSGPVSNKLMKQTGDSISQVYLYAISRERLMGLFRMDFKLALPLLLVMLLSMVISISFILFLTIRAARREILLRAKLIKQMEATQQAERKSMNKSLAFASASHDVRAALATITGLIEFCYEEVHPRSKLKMNLVQINNCVEDLLGILNSILDISKIEAGKMQLVEDEFNLVELLEDVVDVYYNVGIRKDIDVVFDPCDDSVFKFSIVKGDRGKHKQILSNLLSNAVKFTTEGHVSLRAWVKKASLANSILDSNHNSMWRCLSQLVYKNRKAYNDFNVLHPMQQNPNTMEFVFEVNDTGKGIPKEKQSYVFENFVQVKETALGQGGHGLGLGIVQSLVRLMGGEIRIMDKEHCERGTCFRFSVFLTRCGATTVTSTGEENTLQSSHISNDLKQNSGLHIRRQTSKFDSSHVVLLIQSDERRRISQRIIESLGIKVSIVNRWEHLFPTLETIKHRLNLNHLSSSGKSEYGSPINYRSKVLAKDGSDFIPTRHKKLSFRNTSFILLVIDVDTGPFLEMHSVIANFNEELYNTRCKVIWLDKPITGTSHAQGLQEDKLVHYEYVVSKPLHGSRLYQLLRILPEFGGNAKGDLVKPKEELVAQINLDPGPSAGKPYRKSKSQLMQSQHEYYSQEGNDKPLSGKKVLVAEDVEVLRKVAIAILFRLGATVDSCVNGEEALEQVSKALAETNSSTKAADKILPYDLIFMDCEMPIMDGYEATTMIRLEERRYGIHIPIVALTAHATAEEATKIVQSGMDFHLTKPLKVDQLLGLLQNNSL
ncbi:histidine kinase CKI1-like [Telopea speciosissima]|uniref:histidine kinase CKI1-like n=1 Tax=Telopea speciosissima TaxID=54955 RepID=UPI001CC821D4|nr:histidine kinase CKI1-like [Telopea speciosissima]